MKKACKLLLVSFLICLFFSCNIGLGKEVDLIEATINITSPERSVSIPQLLEVSGSASDNDSLKTIEVSVTETKQKFRLVNETQTWEKLVGEDWVPYLSGTCSGDSKKVDFTLSFVLEGVVSGQDCTLVSIAYDELGNEGKTCKDERIVTVDIEAPAVSITEPTLISDYTTASTTFNAYTLKDNSVLSELHNGDFTVSGSQKEDVRPQKLEVYIDEGTELTAPEGKIENYVFYQEVSGESLRNWEVTVKKESLGDAYKTGKHLFRLITRSYDIAGNCENKVQGWFTYWNEADKPWISATFGGETTSERKLSYPNSTLQGQAYDDDGLQKVIIEVYKNGTTKVTDKCQTIDLDSEGNPTYYAWTTSVLNEHCEFDVIAKCIDVNGIESEIVKRYLSVEDVNPPKITVESPTDLKAAIQGDGTFTFKGYLEDDGAIDSFKIAKIAYGKDETEVQYFVKTYSEWNKASVNGTVDKNGNKVWDISLTNPEIQPNENQIRRFNKTFNLYTDFGINGTTELLSTQKFILFSKDSGGEAYIEMLSLGGDSETPILTIDTITVNNGTPVEINDPDNIPTLKPFEPTDTIVLKGTWSDNSKKSLDIADNINIEWKNFTGNISVIKTGAWDEVLKLYKGTWTASLSNPPKATTASIIATMSDWGGNSARKEASFYVDSTIPQFVRISSKNSSASYKAGDEIFISMEFNKKVSFSGGTRNPELELNNGGKATYVQIDPKLDGNGTSKHYFQYTVTKTDTSDVDKLTVLALITNGNTWADAEHTENKVTDMNLPTSNLDSNRSITIDTKPAEFTDFTTNTKGGSYKAGTVIYIIGKLNETVTVESVSDLKLNLEGGGEAIGENASGDEILFKYTVSTNQNASTLKINTITKGNCKITDKAKNKMETFTVPTGKGEFTGIKIDTTKPNNPSLSESSVVKNNQTLFTIDASKKIIIDWNTTENTTKKYSLDGGSSWNTYPDRGIPIPTSNGAYHLTAKQTDDAGNESGGMGVVNFTVDKGNLITLITADKSDGTYKKNEEIKIKVKFRKELDIDSSNKPKVTLNVNNGTKETKEIEYTSGAGTTEFIFNYIVGDGDSCTELKVTNISGKFIYQTNDVSSGVDLISLNTENKLESNRTISIVTKAPEVSTVELLDDKLTVTFKSNINKNTGDIIIQQDEASYKAPVVLTTAQYREFGGDGTAMETYYELGTNGSDSKGNSDLSEKYILKYDSEVDEKNLCDYLKGLSNSPLKITIPVGSSNVTVNSSDRRKLEISLTGSYALPVKGANYIVTIPEKLVIDDIQNESIKPTDTYEIIPEGVEPPVIRVNKSSETISNSVAVQPLTATVKIDTQTPRATIRYTQQQIITNTTEITKTSLRKLLYEDKTIHQPVTGKPTGITDPKTSGTEYTGELTIGNDSDVEKGYKILLMACASIGTGNSVIWSEPGYEFACRTIVRLENSGLGSLTTENGNYPNGSLGDKTAIWLRGGDSEAGGVTTPGFPTSWDPGEYSKARLMTKTEGDNAYWYWSSWNINTTAYVTFLLGNVPNDSSTKGPSIWTWITNGFTFAKAQYPLYPGESLTYSSTEWGNESYEGRWWANVSFQKKQLQQRNGSDTTSTQNGEYIASKEE